MKYFIAFAAASLVMISTIGAAKSQEKASGPSGEEQSIVEAALIAEAIKIMEQNIKASGRESGEIDKLIRALSGISVKDIRKYGICGGPNSEARKLAGSLCNDIN